MILTLSKNFGSMRITSRSVNDGSNYTGEADNTKTVRVDDNERHRLMVTNDSLIMTR